MKAKAMPVERWPRVPGWLKVVREPGQVPAGVRIREPEDAHRILRPLSEAEEVEVFWVLLLDSQSQVRGAVEVSRGTLNASLVRPGDVFRLAVLYHAAGIIVAHNHPSGDATPSAEDREVTRGLVAAGRLLDIPVYDHVVLGAGDRFTSFASAGLL